MRLRVGHHHSRFWPILARFMVKYSLFWDPKSISMVVEPQGSLTCRSSTLIVWADSCPFHALLLTMLGSRSDSTIDEPWGGFMCRSSALTVLADSGPFHGQVLTVLGSQIDFHGCGTPRFAYASVINTHSLGRSWPVSWTITHCFGVPE